MITRRSFVARMSGMVAMGAVGQSLGACRPESAASGTPITVFKSSTCECCAKWVDHLRANGFAPVVHDEEGMDAIKDRLRVPKDLRSCHTAQVPEYLIEGHVPAADIRRLLAERPQVAGLAVPGMPGGTPGMAQPGEKIEGFDVVAFQKSGGTLLFARY